MTLKSLTASSVGALFLALAAQGVSAAPAAAPVPPAAPAAPPLTHGPALAGVCLLSEQQAIAGSTVGGYVRTRLDQIVTQVRAELSPEDAAIAADGKALDAAKTTLDQATLQTRAQALQQRYQAFQQKADLRQREVKATQDKALNRIAQELEPIAQQLYVAHHCSILLDKGTVLTANPDMDLTAAAAAGLNAKITQFPFDREHLDTGVPAAK